MSAPLEALLRPGEEVRFEAHAKGFAPLSARAAMLYATALMVVGLVGLLGVTIPLPVGKLTIPMPVLAPVAALIFLGELYRTARFRSRVYLVTPERVLLHAGIFRSRIEQEIPIDAVMAVRLVAGTAALVTEEATWILSGLDSVDLESIAHGLSLPTREPLRGSLWTRRGRRAALVLALVWVVGVEVETRIQLAGATEWRRVFSGVKSALTVAEANATRAVEGQGGRLDPGHGSMSAEAPWAAGGTVDFWASIEHRDGRQAEIHVSASVDRRFSLLPVRTTVVVRVAADSTDHASFLADLRRLFAMSGIEATWPDGSKH